MKKKVIVQLDSKGQKIFLSGGWLLSIKMKILFLVHDVRAQLRLPLLNCLILMTRIQFWLSEALLQ